MQKRVKIMVCQISIVSVFYNNVIRKTSHLAWYLNHFLKTIWPNFATVQVMKHLRKVKNRCSSWRKRRVCSKTSVKVSYFKSFRPNWITDSVLSNTKARRLTANIRLPSLLPPKNVFPSSVRRWLYTDNDCRLAQSSKFLKHL